MKFSYRERRLEMKLKPRPELKPRPKVVSLSVTHGVPPPSDRPPLPRLEEQRVLMKPRPRAPRRDAPPFWALSMDARKPPRDRLLEPRLL